MSSLPVSQVVKQLNKNRDRRDQYLQWVFEAEGGPAAPAGCGYLSPRAESSVIQQYTSGALTTFLMR
jgi:hypothetical protein